MWILTIILTPASCHFMLLERIYSETSLMAFVGKTFLKARLKKTQSGISRSFDSQWEVLFSCSK